MTLRQWLVLGATVVSGAISAYVHAGGPDPLVAGVPMLTTLFGVLSMFMQSPLKGSSNVAP